MVQYTKILVASAVAAAVPALTAPFPDFESREIENIDAREPLFGAFKKVVSDGASRRVTVTNPIKKTANNAVNSHANSQQKQTRPLGPVLKAAVTAQQNQKKASSSRRKRNLEDLLERDLFDANNGNIDAREPLFGAFKKVVSDGASRRVTVTNPIKKTANNAVNSHNLQQKQTRPLGPVLKAAVTTQQNQKQASSSRRKRNLEDLFERDLFDLD